jgi:hypothetical protein
MTTGVSLLIPHAARTTFFEHKSLTRCFFRVAPLLRFLSARASYGGFYHTSSKLLRWRASKSHGLWVPGHFNTSSTGAGEAEVPGRMAAKEEWGGRLLCQVAPQSAVLTEILAGIRKHLA